MGNQRESAAASQLEQMKDSDSLLPPVKTNKKLAPNPYASQEPTFGTAVDTRLYPTEKIK